MAERHLCHALGCAVAVPPRLLFCWRHWRMVPRHLQADVWRYYRTGQERTKDPTVEYLLAARRAIHHVALLEGRITEAEAAARTARLEELLTRSTTHEG